jgi:hypothetical protein
LLLGNLGKTFSEKNCRKEGGAVLLFPVAVVLGPIFLINNKIK